MKYPSRVAPIGVALVALVFGAPSRSQAVTVNFDVGSGQPPSYTESGLTVAPVVGTENHVHLGDNDGNTSPDLMLHPGCCSTPYRFTYSGGAFSVAQLSFVRLGGTHTFTASSGAVQSPAASGTLVFPPAGWNGITFFEWHDAGTLFSEQGVVDDLQFCPGDCSDANDCTTDACDPDDAGADASGCVHVNNADPCDDDLFCNGMDTCDSGGCNLHAGDPCATGSQCADACNEGAESCLDPLGVACTADSNPCTDDQCDGAGACVHPGKPDGAACDDGNSCTDGDTCTGGVCDGTPAPQTCNDGNPCTLDTCNPGGGCNFDAAGRDGFVCDDQNTCTQADSCLNGMCIGGVSEADSDADGFCDRVENDAGCNVNDFNEIPPRANVFGGAPGLGPGEGFETWAAPGLERVPRTTDPSCRASGTCGPLNFCTAGRLWDPCLTDTDCDQAADVCRLVVTYATGVPDLAFVFLKTSRGASVTSAEPIAPGCSRKIDFTPNPARTTSRVKIRLSGTVGGRFVRDLDRFRFGNY